MKNILLSIIVIVYNIEIPYLEKCLDSIGASMLGDLETELIIVDDGSSISVAKKCDGFQNKYINVRVIHQDNAGSSVARNTGIENASGKWVTFIDGDDWVERNYVQIIKCNLNENYDAIWFNHNDINDKKSINKCIGRNIEVADDELEFCQLAVFQEAYSLDRYPMFFGAVWQAVYKKDVLYKNSLLFVKGLARAQDAVFNLYFLEYSKKIKYIDISLYNYRIYNNSVCHRYNDRTNTYKLLFNEFYNFLSTYNKDEKFYDAYNVFGFRYFLEILRLNYYHKDCPKSWHVINEELHNLINIQPFKRIISDIKGNKLTTKRRLVLWLIRNNCFFTLKLLAKISVRFLI